jgi:sulfur-oxidizing protein SoxA
MRRAWLATLAAAAACHGAGPPPIPVPLRSGVEFTGDEVRKLQADDFANPGMLWVVRGEKLWREPAGKEGKSCAACHGDAATSMKGVAARRADLAGQVNACREGNQRAPAFAQESDDLLGMTAWIAHQSRGMPLAIRVDEAQRDRLDRGRELYMTRIGQMNLACTHCHDRNWGRRLGAETISQGHANAYPAYRLEWQSLGSLARRIRACYFGVRAPMPEYGAADLLALELYVTWRGNGLPVETPGVRR